MLAEKVCCLTAHFRARGVNAMKRIACDAAQRGERSSETPFHLIDVPMWVSDGEEGYHEVMFV